MGSVLPGRRVVWYHRAIRLIARRHDANLDEGAMGPTAFATKELTAAEDGKIGALVKKAIS